jgi:hypothetical protein
MVCAGVAAGFQQPHGWSAPPANAQGGTAAKNVGGWFNNLSRRGSCGATPLIRRFAPPSPHTWGEGQQLAVIDAAAPQGGTAKGDSAMVLVGNSTAE